MLAHINEELVEFNRSHHISSAAVTSKSAVVNNNDAFGRTLVISWGLPPALVGSSAIVEKLSHQFSRDEMVLVGDAWPSWREYKRDPNLPEIHYVFHQPSFKGRRTIRTCLAPLVIHRISRIAGRGQFDRVMGMFPDEFYLWAAYHIAKKHKLPFYPFLHNTYVENRTGMKGFIAPWLQRKIFRAAKIVFVANDGMREFYEQEYPGLNVKTLDHINEESIPGYQDPPAPNSMLKVAYVGTFNPSNADAFARFVRTIQPRSDVQFTTYSNTPAAAFAAKGLSGQNFQHTSVPYDQVVAASRQHDVLFLPHGFGGRLSQVEYDTIFPTRTVPYLLAGRPILAHSPPSSFLTRWLRENDCALVVDQSSPEQLLAGLDRLRTDHQLRCHLVRNALAAARQFQPDSVIQRFKAAVMEAEQCPSSIVSS